MENKEFITKLAKIMNREGKDVSALLDGLSQVFKENLSNLVLQFLHLVSFTLKKKMKKYQ